MQKFLHKLAASDFEYHKPRIFRPSSLLNSEIITVVHIPLFATTPDSGSIVFCILFAMLGLVFDTGFRGSSHGGLLWGVCFLLA